jgi:hypothetical protein
LTLFSSAGKLLEDLRVACSSTSAYARVGTQVVGCESRIVTVTGADAREMQPGGLKCDYGQIATTVVTPARARAIDFDDEGFDDPVEAKRVSQEMDTDGECLWAGHRASTRFSPRASHLGFDLTGGLAITGLQLTLGVI